MTRMVVVMVAALMLAQWGAQHHAYSHDADPATEQHSHAKPCPQCPSFAPVLTVAGSPVLFSAIHWAPIHLSESSLPVAILEVPIILAFRSRAPPPRSAFSNG
jgi:hypothetical protein